MSKLKKTMDQILSAVCAVMFSFMTVIAVYQVVTRYVFNNPSSFSEELLTYSFAWMSMFAATLVFGERDHMRLAYFADKLTEKKGILLAVATECIILVFTVLVLIYGGISITKLTMTQVTASLGIPMGYVYSIMPVSGVLTAVYSIINIANLCGQLKAQ
ncbi:TRAP transporter small permease [Clostridium sp. Marseille-P2415]|uniref:TRAP transporter small permease n=1 Tax=Clostridium sp. Marseille-P2415 TaxID=1805471 RepID=UPI001F46BB2D|nr:TRAP transporter small permease [Clostridium sp. Marseille-P2415]